MFLWWVFWDALPEIFYRDVRLTAAIILGRYVLSPILPPDAYLLSLALLIHFSLSIFYVGVFAKFMSRFNLVASFPIGIMYGIIIFVINMYGFTRLFPWFAVTRDWITLLSHVVFGISAVRCYRARYRY